MTALMEVRDLRAGYGAGPDILNGLSLDIEEGATYCVIGPNGAGKSTFLKAVSGSLRPRAGMVSFAGKDLTGLGAEKILAAGVSFIPQDPSIFQEMTVRENMMMGGYLLKSRVRAAERCDEVVKGFPALAERLSQQAGLLSGGQQQMLALARGLMLQPRLMLVDEPSLGLAPKVVNEVFAVLADLVSGGLTLLLVEQNVARGLAATDKGIVLDLGTIRFEAPSEEVLQDPRIRELYLGASAPLNSDNES